MFPEFKRDGQKGLDMPAMSKKQKKHLQELSDRCYELEMSAALNRLYDDFIKWKNEKIDAWDLNESVHQHHDGTARSLYNFYEVLRNPQNAVAHGVVKGIIQMDDIQKDCHPFVERLIEYYKQQKESTAT